MSTKFPRIPHLPFSPGATNDDRRLETIEHLLGRGELVITEKLDGSNLCWTREALFARSHSGSPRHPSFDRAKAYHAGVQRLIPAHLSVFGEWCYAVHSIEYTGLKDYFNVFAVRDDATEMWLSWQETLRWALKFGVTTVPELCGLSGGDARDIEEVVQRGMQHRSLYGHEREGVVVRLSAGFPDEDFARNVAKCVRANHLRTGDDWARGEFRKQPLRVAGWTPP